MKTIDTEKWERREIYECFSKLDYPFYAVTIPMDVTVVKMFADKNGVSSYHAMIWACTEACNSVPEFRYRIRDGVLVDTERVNPSFTAMRKGDTSFRIITIPHEDRILDFCRSARAKAETQESFIVDGSETDDLVYFSCTPWFDFTMLSNERNLDRDDMIPRIAWGKYYEESGMTMVHMSVDVNHRAIDGYHIGQFKSSLDDIIAHIGDK